METTKQQRLRKTIHDVLLNAASADKDLRFLADIEDFNNATNEEIDTICEAMLAELTRNGLGADSEPTKRGLEIEEAIDWIRKFRC